MKQISLHELSKAIKGAKECKEDYKQPHLDKIDELIKLLPHGSGIDAGIQLMLELSNENKIVFHFEFHHMNDNGYYINWTGHNLTLTPSFLNGFNIKISGRNQNDIKSYLYDLFIECFTS